MQALVNEILQCIIHKPVARHAAFARKSRAGDANPKVGAKTLGIGTHMACMLGALVGNFQVRGLKTSVELLLKGAGVYGCNSHGLA